MECLIFSIARLEIFKGAYIFSLVFLLSENCVVLCTHLILLWHVGLYVFINMYVNSDLMVPQNLSYSVSHAISTNF